MKLVIPHAFLFVFDGSLTSAWTLASQFATSADAVVSHSSPFGSDPHAASKISRAHGAKRGGERLISIPSVKRWPA